MLLSIFFKSGKRASRCKADKKELIVYLPYYYRSTATIFWIMNPQDLLECQTKSGKSQRAPEIMCQNDTVSNFGHGSYCAMLIGNRTVSYFIVHETKIPSRCTVWNVSRYL